MAMARHTKIYRGPAYMPMPQVRELPAAAATLPGTIVRPSADGTTFEVATEASGSQIFITQDNYLALRGTADAVPSGDVLIGMQPLPDRIFAARLATGNDVTVGDPLSVGAGGLLSIAGSGDDVVAYAEESYNNDTGDSELIDVRFVQSRTVA